MSALRISVPGQPPRLIVEDPYVALSSRQRRVLEVVLAHRGDRRRAARALGVSTNSVFITLRRCAARGARIPPGLGTRSGVPNDRPRSAAPRCGIPLERVNSTCALPAGHRIQHHRSVESMAKDAARRVAPRRVPEGGTGR